MKIFLSRKSFDSGSGGSPSIIYDNKLIPLPIPQIINKEEYKEGKKIYNDLHIYEGCKIQDILKDVYSDLNNKFMHLDPDLRKESMKKRSNGWKPSLGQIGIPQSILKKAKIEVGDLFLFFGWFKEVELDSNRYISKKKAKDLHIIYGYLKIGEIITADMITSGTVPEWIKDEHPHFLLKDVFNKLYKNNTIYIAHDQLGFGTNKPGAGIFELNEHLILTDTHTDNNKRSKWKISDVFHTEDIEIKTILEGKKERMKAHISPYIEVDANVGQGQEYPIIDNEKGTARNWALDIIKKSTIY